MNPARTSNLWLATSASAGASRNVWLNSSVIRFQDERNRPLCHLSTANFTRPSQGRQRLFWPRQGNRRVGQSLSHGSGIDVGLLAGQVAVAGWTAKGKALLTLLSRCMPYDP